MKTTKKTASRTYYAVPESLEAQALATQTEDRLAVATGDTPEELAVAFRRSNVVLGNVRVLVREGDTLRRATEEECERMY